MNKSKKSTIQDLCHLCLENDIIIFNIFENDEDGVLLSDKLEAITGIKVTSKNDFPKYLCLFCRQKLVDSYEFRKLCISSKEILNVAKDIADESVKGTELDSETYFPDALYFVEIDEDIRREFDIGCEFETDNYLYYEENVSENEKVKEILEEEVDQVEDELDGEKTSVVEPDIYANLKEAELCANKVVTENGEDINSKNADKCVTDVCEELEKEKDEINEECVCKFCNKIFLSENRVRMHVKRVHKQMYLADSNVACTVCGMKFRHPKDLKLHTVSHNKDSYYACNFCDEKYYSKKSWRKHIKVHADDQYEICKICNKTILTNISFVYHMDWHRMRQALEDNKFYSCQTCDIHFHSFDELEKHTMERHCLMIPHDHDYLGSDVEPGAISIELTSSELNGIEISKPKYRLQNINASVIFRCNLCNRYFRNLLNVKPHVSECYDKMDRPKPYMCDTCGKRFTSAWSLNNHKRGHSDVKTFICDICGQRFKWHNDLTNHKNRIHNKLRPYVCKLCGKRCGTSATLKSHMRHHTGEKPYCCHICNAAFSQNSSLKEHMFKHTGGKEEACHICNKVFRTPLRLRTHLKRHSTYRKRYPCDLCGRQFTEKNSVRKHKYKIHQVN